MGYCSTTDITSAVTSSDLVQLTNDAGGTSVDTTKITEAISYVDNIVDGYLRGRYQLPLTSTPDELKYIAVDFVVYRLYSRRMTRSVPENILQRYKEIQQFLKDIQSGKFSLGIEDTNEIVDSRMKTNKSTTISTSNKYFTEEKWDGYGSSWL